MNEHLNTDEAVSNVHGLGHVDGSPDILLGQTKVVDCTVGQTELLHLRGWQIAFKTQDQFVDQSKGILPYLHVAVNSHTKHA